MKTLSSLKNNRKSELERYLKNKKYPDYVNREYLKFHGPDLFGDLQGN